MNPWMRNLLCGGGGGGGGGPVLPPTGRTMLANLKSSLILDEGTGGPTWSRATKAWGFNELGYLEELPSGCAFFGGARLVRNLLRGTEDSSNVAWSKSTGSTGAQATDSGGGNTALLFSYTSSQSHLVYQYQSASNCQATYCFSFKFKTDSTHGWWRALIYDGSSNQCRVWFNAQTGVIGTASGGGSGVIKSASITDSGGGWFTLTLTGSPGIAALGVFAQIGANDADNSSAITTVGAADALTIERPSLVDVTNYDASYAPEYVSVGVEASPYFGAGIDGAKYFETDWQGAPIAAANLLGFRREAAATNNLLGGRDFFINWTPAVVAGTLFSDDFSSYADTAAMTAAGWAASASTTQALSSAAILITNAGAVYGSSSKAITTEIGKSYLVTFAFTKTTANCGSYVANTATASTIDRLNTASATVTGAYSLVFTATATTTYLVFGLNSNTVGHEIKIDDVLVKESKVTVTKATGLDGIANTATTLTATAADAIILQPITLASAARCASAYVKRRTGTGTISFTQDGGGSWTDITSLINSSTWSRVQITSTLANPSVGFKISTSGDAIDVDCVQNEAGAVATSPIVTTTAAVTRNIDMLSYQSASNIDFTVGTCFAKFGSPASAYIGYPVSCGNSGRILYGDATPAIRVYDGTTVISKATTGFINGGFVKAASSWNSGNSTQKLSVDGSAVVSGAFDGSMGSGAVINIASETSSAQPVYVGPVAIYNYQMTDAELQAITA